MYVCTHTRTHAHTHMCVCVHVRIDVWLYSCVSVYVLIHKCTIYIVCRYKSTGVQIHIYYICVWSQELVANLIMTSSMVKKMYFTRQTDSLYTLVPAIIRLWFLNIPLSL